MSAKSLFLSLCQSNPTVGNLEFNVDLIKSHYKNAKEINADLAIFSELNLTGYVPEDLLNKKYFIAAVAEKISEICKITSGEKTALLIGAPVADGDKLYNAALLIEDGKIIQTACKTDLPNYAVFDEKRYFTPAPSLTNFNFRGFEIAVLICEDIWHMKNADALKDKNIDLVISINASPFDQNKLAQRFSIAKEFIKNIKKPLIYVNQIGGVDAIIFDGNSFVLDESGKIALMMKSFAENQELIEVQKLNQKTQVICKNKIEKIDSVESQIYSAVTLGLRDYIKKTGFKKVLLGMSGGIDSAIVATIAVDALGSENVKLVALPSQYNSQQSMDDAALCAKNLGVNLEVIEIEPIFNAMNSALSEQFKNSKPDLTEENIQSRIRGNLLMAMSNKFGNLLLSTGNKSEMAVGYATIYGDMCGAYNPIKDIYKTEIFKLSKWRNKNIPEISVYKKINLIPDSIITKAPSAELRPDQKDSDSLPEYEILDAILFKIIEEEKSVLETVKETGFAEELVKKIAKLFYSSEYKRKQAVIGTKISKMSFDKDRRYLISNGFWK